jgi:hypothetical protein
MKTLIIIITTFLLCNSIIAQKGKGHGAHHQKFEKQHPHKQYSSKKVVYYQPALVVKRKGPPSWAPANGYRHRYVFFPEHNCYYDNFNGIYIYRKGGTWVNSYTMPSFIFNINFTRKVELTIDAAPKPQIYFEHHVALYD